VFYGHKIWVSFGHSGVVLGPIFAGQPGPGQTQRWHSLPWSKRGTTRGGRRTMPRWIPAFRPSKTSRRSGAWGSAGGVSSGSRHWRTSGVRQPSGPAAAVPLSRGGRGADSRGSSGRCSWGAAGGRASRASGPTSLAWCL